MRDRSAYLEGQPFSDEETHCISMPRMIPARERVKAGSFAEPASVHN